MTKKYTVPCPDCGTPIEVEIIDRIGGACATCPDPDCGCEFEVDADGTVRTEDDVDVTCPECGREWVEHDVTDYAHYTVCPGCGHDFEIDLDGQPLEDDDDDDDCPCDDCDGKDCDECDWYD